MELFIQPKERYQWEKSANSWVLVSVPGFRAMLSVKKKRSDIAEGKKEGWIMLNEDEQWTKYTNELLDALEYWIENNDMVQHSPFKDNLVIKQDQDGSIVRDSTTRLPVRV